MRTRIIIFILMSMLIWVNTVNAQSLKMTTATDTISVTFQPNTSTIPDTMSKTSTVQVRGGRYPLGWDSNDAWFNSDTTKVFAKNIGGDYWKATAKFFLTRGDTAIVLYKYFTNAKDSITSADKGWENNLTGIGGGNRVLCLGPLTGNLDTTLPLEYANGRTVQAQFWKPYLPSADSVAVMFRVNMQANEGFNKSTMKLGVRGDMAPLSKSYTIFLKKESPHGNSGQSPYDGTNFWSGVVKFPKSAASDTVHYKFVIHALADDSSASPAYENNITAAPDVGADGYRFFNFRPDMPDTTLYWKFWQNMRPGAIVFSDNIIITFRADLAKAISENGFAYGDTLVVRSGYINSASAMREKRMLRVGASSKYQAVDTVTTKFGTQLFYQYYETPSSGEVREIYYNFAITSPDSSGTAVTEKRRYGMSSYTLTIRDTINSESAEHRMPRFQNMQPLSQNVLVTFTCDVRPAIYQLKKGSKLISTNITNYVISDPDSVLIYGVWMNGPAVGGWDIGGAWGADRRLIDTCKMWDDGTHGDAVAGDSIFTLMYLESPNNTYSPSVGTTFKFGIYGCDNEGGYGNNHIENINDANPTATIASQFGSIDPLFYNAWDYNNERPTGVERSTTGLPLAYNLEQNYPNPFNPSTLINYEIKQSGKVTMKVFNILGQVVATLTDGIQEAGKHSLKFDASRFSSGIYFYQITAGNFVATKKMMFLK